MYSSTNKFVRSVNPDKLLQSNYFIPAAKSATAHARDGIPFIIPGTAAIYTLDIYGETYKGKKGTWLIFYARGNNTLKAPANADDCYVPLSEMMVADKSMAAAMYPAAD